MTQKGNTFQPFHTRNRAVAATQPSNQRVEGSSPSRLTSSPVRTGLSRPTPTQTASRHSADDVNGAVSFYYDRISPALEFFGVWVATFAYLRLMDTLSGSQAAVVSIVVGAGVAWRLR